MASPTLLEFTRKSTMPAGTETEHTQHLRLRETQMSLKDETCPSPGGEDFEGQLREAQQQLEVLQHQREQLEQQKCEMDDLNRRKEDFISGQIEITERLSGSVTSIDRELFELRQELEDLEQTRHPLLLTLLVSKRLSQRAGNVRLSTRN